MSYDKNKYSYRKCSIEEIYATHIAGKANWRILSDSLELTEEILEEFKSVINWHRIIFNFSLSFDMIDNFSEYFNWNRLCRYKQMPIELLIKHKDKVDWKAAFEHQRCLSEYFIIEI